jgi:hypothetical protein
MVSSVKLQKPPILRTANAGVTHAHTKRNVGFVSPGHLVGCGSGSKGCNFLLLAAATRETVSTRAALHAGTWTEMARQARSFWLSRQLLFSKDVIKSGTFAR